MTTPLMPFSVPQEPSLGGYAMSIPVEFRNHNDSNSAQTIKLSPGVSVIRITWDGAESIRYRLDRTGSTGAWITAIEESQSLQRRSSKIIEVALTAPAYFHVQSTHPVSAASIDAKSRAGVTVIPTAGPQS